MTTRSPSSGGAWRRAVKAIPAMRARGAISWGTPAGTGTTAWVRVSATAKLPCPASMRTRCPTRNPGTALPRAWTSPTMAYPGRCGIMGKGGSESVNPMWVPEKIASSVPGLTRLQRLRATTACGAGGSGTSKGSQVTWLICGKSSRCACTGVSSMGAAGVTP